MLRCRVATSLLWTLSGAAGRTVLFVLVLVVLARLLTPHDYGVVSAAMVVVRFSNILSQLGVGPALIQRPELRPAHVRTGLALSMLLGISLAAIVWLLASPITAFLRIEELRAVLAAMCLIFPIQAISVVADSLLQRELKFGRIALTELTSDALGYGLTGIALALAGYGYWALVGAILAQTLLRSILLLAARPHLLMPMLEPRAARELIYFGAGHTGGRGRASGLPTCPAWD